MNAPDRINQAIDNRHSPQIALLIEMFSVTSRQNRAASSLAPPTDLNTLCLTIQPCRQTVLTPFATMNTAIGAIQLRPDHLDRRVVQPN